MKHFFFILLFVTVTSHYTKAETIFMLQSIDNIDKFILIDNSNSKINFIIMPEDCAKCPTQFAALVKFLKQTYNTDYGLKAIIAGEVYRTIARDFKKLPLSPEDQKLFYFDPGGRLASYVRYKDSKTGHLVAINRLSIRASTPIDLNNFETIFRYKDTWR